jgi:hypothetical protein
MLSASATEVPPNFIVLRPILAPFPRDAGRGDAAAVLRTGSGV